MDKSTSRIISKAGFLLIIMGFLLPVMFNQNGFQIIKYLSTQFLENNEYLSDLYNKNVEHITELYSYNSIELQKKLDQNTENFSIFKINKNIIIISLYSIFIFSCIGALSFLLLLFKKQYFSIILDWVLITISIIIMLSIFSSISNILRYIPNEFDLFDISGSGKIAGSITSILSPLLNIGTYIIVFGIIISIIFNLMSSFAYEKNGKTFYDIKTILILFVTIQLQPEN